MNRKYKYPVDLLKHLAEESVSVRAMLRKLGVKLTGGNHRNLTKQLRDADIDISHFLGRVTNQGPDHKGGSDKRAWQDILKYGHVETSKLLRLAAIESGKIYECAECGQMPVWRSKRLVLQLHHKDGDKKNNRPDNLEFLCPNCHSQTDNYGHKNRRKGGV